MNRAAQQANGAVAPGGHVRLCRHGARLIRGVGPTRIETGKEELDPSVPRLWAGYLAKSGRPPSTPVPAAWHFCDNELDADICAGLVLTGRKRATSPSLWFFELHGLVPPSVGHLDIVTNWKGVAQCIIWTTAVHIVRFREVTAEHARLEGEGDGSLESWRAVHRAYYQRELQGTKYEPNDDMPIVCQYFEVVFP